MIVLFSICGLQRIGVLSDPAKVAELFDLKLETIELRYKRLDAKIDRMK